MKVQKNKDKEVPNFPERIRWNVQTIMKLVSHLSSKALDTRIVI